MKRGYLLKIIGVTIMLAGILNGCGSKEMPIVTVNHTSYEKLAFQTEEVVCGDLSANVKLELYAEGYEEVTYSVARDDLEVDRVHVSVGDRVKKGDVLVSFGSESIMQRIAEYEESKEQMELLLHHYQNMMEIDEELEYELDIVMLEEDIQIATLYIEEAKEQLKDYRILAKGDGIVTEISDYLQNNVVKPDVMLIKQITGTGRYLAEVANPELYVTGEVYTINAEGIESKLEVVDVTDNTIIMEPVSGARLVSADKRITLERELPEQKNVVYVNRHAVCTVGEKENGEETHCVYVMQENGYQRAVFVTPGERIGDYIIIKEGLKGGEWVVIR